MEPSPIMSMNRLIHRAVRRDLDRLCEALAAFVDGDRERAGSLHRARENSDAQLTEHHQGEHEIAWPALAAIGIAGPTIDSFDTEHEVVATDLAGARDAMRRLKGSASRSDATPHLPR